VRDITHLSKPSEFDDADRIISHEWRLWQDVKLPADKGHQPTPVSVATAEKTLDQGWVPWRWPWQLLES
jgi:hypothetical protein